MFPSLASKPQSGGVRNIKIAESTLARREIEKDRSREREGGREDEIKKIERGRSIPGKTLFVFHLSLSLSFLRSLLLVADCLI